MNNKKILNIVLIIGILLIMIGGTFAWLNYRSNDTTLVLTVGDIKGMLVTVKPYQIKGTLDFADNYLDSEALVINVDATNNNINKAERFSLYFDISSIDTELKQSEYFKWKITKSIDNGSTYQEVANSYYINTETYGNFTSASTDENFIIYSENVPANTTNPYKYKVYIWLENDPNANQSNLSFNAELRAIIGFNIINSIEDLVRLSNDVNSGNSYEGVTIGLIRDLDFNNANSYENATDTSFGDLNEDGTTEDIKTELTKTTGKGFTPIGNVTNNFSGNFDGLNHRIDNLYINNSNSEIVEKLGLIGCINNSTINNLTVSGTINSSVEAHSGLVGFSYGNNKINNVTNEITISSTVRSGSIGGIIGEITSGNVTISNSINKANLSNSYQPGGLVGFNSGTLTINDSHNEGAITNNLGKASGGLVARIKDNLTINDSYNIGNVSGDTADYIGGLLGVDDAATTVTTITNSYNTGEISSNATTDKSVYVGGAVGKIYGTLTIDSSYNTAKITNSRTSYSGNYEVSLGGILGCAYNNSRINIDNSYNTGDVSEGNRNAGIVGYIAYDATVYINKCYNTGTITETTIPASDWARVVGGIVGYSRNNNTYIINSYNTGIITNNASSMAGGIIGNNNITDNQKVIVLNSYNKGSVTTNHTSYGGGIVGLSNKNLTLKNVYNVGTVASASYKYGIGYMSATTGNSISTSYYKSGTGITASNQSISATGKDDSDMKATAFVTLLNNNISGQSPSSIDSALSGYTYSTWKLETNGYPVFDD